MPRARSQKRRSRKREAPDRRQHPLLRGLDDWFPVLARYGGLGLIGYCVFGDHLKHAYLLTAAIGLTVLKTLWGGNE